MAKIAILGPAYPLRGGGLATFNERLARAFTEYMGRGEGNEVFIYTFSLQYPSLLFPGKSQYSDEDPPSDLDIRVRLNSINPVNWIRVGREIAGLKPDILVVRYWLPFMAPCLGTVSGIVRKNGHTRVITIADNIVPHEKRPADRMLTRYFLKKVDSFVVMSDTVVKDLRDFGVKAERISYCPHPLYDNFGNAVKKENAREELGIDAGEKLVLFFGFIRDYKGLDILIQAMGHESVKKLGVKLLVAGEFYVKPDHYHKLATDLKIDGNIIWHTDFIPNNRVRYYFSAADLVAQPYKSATQSGVTHIAYHFLKPMLVTNVGGLPEMVTDGKAGYVVRPEPGAIASAIRDYFENKREASLIDTLKEEKKRFSWESFVKNLIETAGI